VAQGFSPAISLATNLLLRRAPGVRTSARPRECRAPGTRRCISRSVNPPGSPDDLSSARRGS